MPVDSHCHLNYLENPQDQLFLAGEGVELGWLTSALGNNKVVGVGETGLDYSRPGENDQNRRHQRRLICADLLFDKSEFFSIV